LSVQIFKQDQEVCLYLIFLGGPEVHS